MKTMLLCAAAAASLATQAGAADLPVKASPSAAPTPFASSWDGLYFGGNVGFGSTDFNASASVFGLSAGESVTGSGIVGGVQLGYNKQFGMMVIGVETDFDGSSMSNSTGGTETKLPWFGTARARFGVLIVPSLLAYGTGGVAYGHAEVSGQNFSFTTPGVGWTAGAGLQYALTPQWSISAEYLHIDLDGPALGVGPLNITTKATTDLGRATLNYKF